MTDFALDVAQQEIVQVKRRLHQFAQIGRTTQTGELHEQCLDVFAKSRTRGQQREIRIAPGRALVVVAGAQVHVAPHLAVLAADDQHHLGVGLVADHAVDDLHPGFLQPGRERDIGFLVEAGPQLHHHGDILAGSRRVDQQPDHDRVGAGSIHRHLDRQHFRITGSLAQQFYGRGEAVIWVVQQPVAPPQRGEQLVAAAEPGRQVRLEW